jgi:hypothetical protein
MSYHEPRPLRLAVASEADALIAKFGSEAYGVACWRAEEASSEIIGDGLARSRANDRSPREKNGAPEPYE